MFEKEIYATRREKLMNLVGKGIILLTGNTESPMNYTDNTYPFRQDSSFLYFFGLDQPGLAGLLDTESGEEVLFGNDFSMDDIIWMGKQTSMQETATRAAVRNQLPFRKLAAMLGDAIRQGRRIHILPPYRAENKLLLGELMGISAGMLAEYASVDLIRAVVKLRSEKQVCEIEEMKKAWATGYQMHLAAMQMALPGISEQTVAGTIDSIPLKAGGMTAYPTILSQHGEILHNHSHGEMLQRGRLLLVDAGAESAMHYASDFTRTTPVGGRFSHKQQEIYSLVLAANNKAKELIKAGITYRFVHMAVAEVIVTGLKELGLMKGDPQEAVNQGAHALFMPHGLGHMIGLDVHDMEDLGQIHVGFDEEIRPSAQFGTASLRLGRKLRQGFTVTNEPGIYFIPALIDKWKQDKIHTGFIRYDKLECYRDFGGIRLEDDLLVTETGCELLGRRIPITPEEVEQAVGA
ncbi:MAG: aminopeptidase P family protein [Mangrovibacterium sp.]